MQIPGQTYEFFHIPEPNKRFHIHCSQSTTQQTMNEKVERPAERFASPGGLWPPPECVVVCLCVYIFPAFFFASRIFIFPPCFPLLLAQLAHCNFRPRCRSKVYRGEKLTSYFVSMWVSGCGCVVMDLVLVFFLCMIVKWRIRFVWSFTRAGASSCTLRKIRLLCECMYISWIDAIKWKILLMNQKLNITILRRER